MKKDIKYYISKKKQDTPSKSYKKYLYRLGFRLLISALIFLSGAIFLKTNPQYKADIEKELYEKNINLAGIKNLYNKYLGNVLPFKDLIKEPVASVFNETLTYNSAAPYEEGVNLTVEKNYLVPAMESGLVVFIGDKEKYGQTIIIQQVNGIDLWYSNVNTSNINLYDYIKKGSLIGEVKDDNLKLVFSREGEFLNYKDYLK